MLYFRNCPLCNIEISYKTKASCNIANLNSTKCKVCAKKSVKSKYLNILTRICPTCNNKIMYNSKYTCNIAIQKNTNCKKCTAIANSKQMHKDIANNIRKNPFFGKTHNTKTKNVISTKVKLAYSNGILNVFEKNNAMYGKTKIDYPNLGISNYDRWVKKYGIEIANFKLQKTRKKLSLSASGKNNPMFGKPSPIGSGNGWSGWYNQWYFRSLLELTYVIDVLDRFKIPWKTGETIRIPYINLIGEYRTYLPDFIINDTYIVEIKPKKLHKSKTVLCKKEAAIKYCTKHNLKYKITSPINLISIDQLLKYIDIGKIKLLPKYQEKLKNYITK